MRRRTFISAASAITLTGTPKADSAGKPPGKPEPVGELAGMSLTALRDIHRQWLFGEFLPFMDTRIIDHEHGGFMCNADRDGTLLSTEKRAGYLGRGIWVYSHLYRTLDQNPKHLETARKTAEFLLRARDPGGRWAPAFTREGEPRGDVPPSVNSDLYIAEGMHEYSLASGDRKYRDLAREIFRESLRTYDSPGYLSDAGKGFLGPDAPAANGVALLDDWMLFLRLATQMLEEGSDPEVETVVKRCRESITNRFFNPDFGLLTEFLNQDLSRFEDGLGRLVTFGNIFQALWHTLDEAARIRDRNLFDLTAERLRRHVEVAWDDVYGGLFGTLRDVDANIWSTAKIAYVQAEALTGLLTIIEHTGADWAREWFGRIFSYTAAKFPLKQYGFPLWMVSGDRRTTFVPTANRVENYHHPRYLLLTIKALNRLVARN